MKNEVPFSCDSESFAYWSHSLTSGTAGIAILSLSASFIVSADFASPCSVRSASRQLRHSLRPQIRRQPAHYGMASAVKNLLRGELKQMSIPAAVLNATPSAMLRRGEDTAAALKPREAAEQRAQP